MDSLRARGQRLAALLTVVSVLAAAGCSEPKTRHAGPDPSGTPASAVPGASTAAARVDTLGSVNRKPCALVTRAEAERAAGQPLGAPLESPDPAECTFATSDSTASVILDLGTWAGISKLLRSVKTGTRTGLQKVAVPGVGDEAIAVSGRGGTPILYVRKGDQGFVLSVSGPEVDGLPDRGLAKAKTLAVAIAGRL